jgi:ubiquitin C-terminal hydrolase
MSKHWFQDAWTSYKRENDSIIVDLFHGIVRSTVSCDGCEHSSVKFEPFCCLQLELPSTQRQGLVSNSLVASSSFFEDLHRSLERQGL